MMDQDKLESDGVGFRCRECGISVMGTRAGETRLLCTACLQDADDDDPIRWQQRRMIRRPKK